MFDCWKQGVTFMPMLGSSSSASSVAESQAESYDAASDSSLNDIVDAGLWGVPASLDLVDWQGVLCTRCQARHDARLTVLHSGVVAGHMWRLELAYRFCCARCGSLELCVECLRRISHAENSLCACTVDSDPE